MKPAQTTPATIFVPTSVFAVPFVGWVLGGMGFSFTFCASNSRVFSPVGIELTSTLSPVEFSVALCFSVVVGALFSYRSIQVYRDEAEKEFLQQQRINALYSHLKNRSQSFSEQELGQLGQQAIELQTLRRLRFDALQEFLLQILAFAGCGAGFISADAPWLGLSGEVVWYEMSLMLLVSLVAPFVIAVRHYNKAYRDEKLNLNVVEQYLVEKLKHVKGRRGLRCDENAGSPSPWGRVREDVLRQRQQISDMNKLPKALQERHPFLLVLNQVRERQAAHDNGEGGQQGLLEEVRVG